MILSWVIATIIYSMLLAYMFGWTEAVSTYYRTRTTKVNRLNPNYERTLWTWIRIIVYLPVGLTMIHLLGLIWGSLGILALLCIFPFIHNGSFYSWSNKFNPKQYLRRWRSFEFSRQRNSWTWATRRNLFFFGVILLSLMFGGIYL